MPVSPMNIVETPTQTRLRAIRLDAQGRPVAVVPASSAATPNSPTGAAARNLPAYTDALLLTLALSLVLLPLPAFIDTPDRAFKRLVVLACIAIPPIVGIVMIQRRLGPARKAKAPDQR